MQYFLADGSLWKEQVQSHFQGEDILLFLCYVSVKMWFQGASWDTLSSLMFDLSIPAEKFVRFLILGEMKQLGSKLGDVNR